MSPILIQLVHWMIRSPPLGAAVLGGEQLTGGDPWIISLDRPERVRAVADALSTVTREWLRQRYDALDPKDYDYEGA